MDLLLVSLWSLLSEKSENEILSVPSSREQREKEDRMKHGMLILADFNLAFACLNLVIKPIVEVKEKHYFAKLEMQEKESDQNIVTSVSA